MRHVASDALDSDLLSRLQGQAWLIRSDFLHRGSAIETEPELLARLKRGDVDVEIDAAASVAVQDVAMPDEPLDVTLEQIIKTVVDVIPRFDGFFVRPFTAHAGSTCSARLCSGRISQRSH